MIEQTTPFEDWIGRGARAIVRSWLPIANGFLALLAGLPWLSPWLRSHGYETAGATIFQVYSAICHQLPTRSFTFDGYPVCYCHRCTAIYSSALLLGLLYSLLRWQRPLPSRLLLLLALPIAVDGVLHLLNDVLPDLALRSTVSDPGSLNFWLRITTGLLLGAGLVLWAYPRVEREAVQI